MVPHTQIYRNCGHVYIPVPTAGVDLAPGCISLGQAARGQHFYQAVCSNSHAEFLTKRLT